MVTLTYGLLLRTSVPLHVPDSVSKPLHQRRPCSSTRVLDCYQNFVRGWVRHVALLWAIGVGVESRESLTVLLKSAYWVMPLAVMAVPYSPVKILSLLERSERILKLVFPHLQLRDRFLLHQTQNCHNFLTVWLHVQMQSYAAILAVVFPYCRCLCTIITCPELPWYSQTCIGLFRLQ